MKVRWPSWLWRQVKDPSLATTPGHVSGVGSNPTLIINFVFSSYEAQLKCSMLGFDVEDLGCFFVRILKAICKCVEISYRVCQARSDDWP